MDATEKIKVYINEEILTDKDRTVDDDENLYEGILDSIALMQLAAFLEDELGVRVLDEDLTPENFRSVSSIARLVREREGG